MEVMPEVVERGDADYLKMNLFGKEVEVKIDGYQNPADKSRGQIVSIAALLEAMGPPDPTEEAVDWRKSKPMWFACKNCSHQWQSGIITPIIGRELGAKLKALTCPNCGQSREEDRLQHICPPKAGKQS